ncbi:MAG TPA: FAD/NAD(P)-binding protein, partial [Candidatus Limnocylindrales bacterium]|nr:FAD/NAD(P)-binding protein [Candidatus Limnocylindrales bacterium]
MAEGRRVVVVGGGASGTLTAIQLLRRATRDATILIVEPRERLGTGVAFGTSDPWHRLNVPAITMSGVPEDPDHFRAFAGCSPDTFPPRHVFGAYLGALLSEARAASPARFAHIRAHATAVRDDPLRVDLSAGPALEADAVVVATG